MKVKVISLPYIFQVLYALCFTRPRYQMGVYMTIIDSLRFLLAYLTCCICLQLTQLLGVKKDHDAIDNQIMAMLIQAGAKLATKNKMKTCAIFLNSGF